jgi:arsenate reductase
VKILEKEKVSFKIIEYLKKQISRKEINNILNILDIGIEELIRKNELEYKSINDDDKKNKNKLIELILNYPKVMQRPVIINDKKGVIGRPPENIYKIL